MFGLDLIKKVEPCKWQYFPPLDDGLIHYGFIAQDLQLVVPENSAFVVKDEDGLLKVNMAEFIAPIVHAIQELDKRLKALEKKQDES